jgi:hypothetical protein
MKTYESNQSKIEGLFGCGSAALDVSVANLRFKKTSPKFHHSPVSDQTPAPAPSLA